MKDVSPLRDWLGLDEAIVVPTHYQLLGLTPEESSDRHRVVAAARERLKALKPFNTPGNREALERLVRQIKNAAQCLQDPAARKKYDTQLRQAVQSAALPPAKAKDEIPEAIPLAIPVRPPESSSPHLATPAPALAIQVDKIAASHRRPRRWVIGASVGAGLVVVFAAILMFWPDGRKRLTSAFLGTSTTAESSDEPRPLPIPDGPPTTEFPEPKLMPEDVEPAPEATPDPADTADSADTNPEVPVSDPPAVESPPPSNAPPTWTVEVPDTLALSDDAVDFLSRAIVVALQNRDVDLAVDLFSYMDPQNISDSRLERYRRMGQLANAYKKYVEWLDVSVRQIPGGTALEIGAQKLPVAIVEADEELVIVRDRGENKRFLTRQLPAALAWGIIEQQRPGQPAAPVVKIIAQSLDQFGARDGDSLLRATAESLETSDPLVAAWRQALIGWWDYDAQPLTTQSDWTAPLGDSGVATQIEQLTSNPPTFTGDARQDWLSAAFSESEPERVLAYLLVARDQAIDEASVDWAECLQHEISRFRSAEDAQEEWIDVAQRLVDQPLNVESARQVCLLVHRRWRDFAENLSAEQQKKLSEILNSAAASAKWDRHLEALKPGARRP